MRVVCFFFFVLMFIENLSSRSFGDVNFASNSVQENHGVRTSARGGV